MDKSLTELQLLKERFHIDHVSDDINADVIPERLFVFDSDKSLTEEFLQKKPNCMLKTEVEELQEVAERVTPEIPMLVNTIENSYCHIAVYGESEYAEKIYCYLLENSNIHVIRIAEKDFEYRNGQYWVNTQQEIEMLLVMDLIMGGEVCDSDNRKILTCFIKNMYRANLKSTGNNLDISTQIIPKLLAHDVNVIWISVVDNAKIKNRKWLFFIIKLWTILRSKNEGLFARIRHYKFHTSYMRKESLSVYNTNIKGISEVFYNGKYINCENGFRFTPGNSDKIQNSVWLYGPCCVRGLNFDDNHTMSAKLQQLVTKRYNVYNRGTVNTCLNYVMRMGEFRRGDVVVFFSPMAMPQDKEDRIRYIDLTEVLNGIPHLGKHITDSFYHCDEIVIDAMVKAIYDNLPEKSYVGNINEELIFGSKIKRVPALEMYQESEYTAWLESLSEYKREGKNGAIVMNANPFTNGHRYLIEYAAARVDNLFVFVVEENKSFFDFKDRIRLVKEGTSELNNVYVLPSSQYIISSSSLPGYFRKEDMGGDFKLDATQDLSAFAQMAQMLDISTRFAGEEPLDVFTNQYNANMAKILPKYGISFCTIPRKEASGRVVSASLVRKYLKEENWEAIRELVPESTFRFLERTYKNANVTGVV